MTVIWSREQRKQKLRNRSVWAFVVIVLAGIGVMVLPVAAMGFLEVVLIASGLFFLLNLFAYSFECERESKASSQRSKLHKDEE